MTDNCSKTNVGRTQNSNSVKPVMKLRRLCFVINRQHWSIMKEFSRWRGCLRAQHSHQYMITVCSCSSSSNITIRDNENKRCLIIQVLLSTQYSPSTNILLNSYTRTSSTTSHIFQSQNMHDYRQILSQMLPISNEYLSKWPTFCQAVAVKTELSPAHSLDRISV